MLHRASSCNHLVFASSCPAVRHCRRQRTMCYRAVLSSCTSRLAIVMMCGYGHIPQWVDHLHGKIAILARKPAHENSPRTKKAVTDAWAFSFDMCGDWGKGLTMLLALVGAATTLIFPNADQEARLAPSARINSSSWMDSENGPICGSRFVAADFGLRTRD